MKARPGSEVFVYVILIVLSLVATGIAVISPSAFTDLNLIYGGF
jgi:thiosulfate reductase cytochrome b subunit